jgi:thiamine monophosphate kinase
MPDDEFDLIRTYFQSLTNSQNGVVHGIGDDAAVLDISPPWIRWCPESILTLM